MTQSMRSSVPKASRKLIGEILQEAGLISSEQIQIALGVQSQCLKLRIGEILALKGWLKQETVDFLVAVCLENKAITSNHLQPIGYYFQKAGLLTEEQINNVLKDQKKLGIKFCYLAVMKGFLKQKTADFFLDNMANKSPEVSLKINQYDHRSQTQTVIGDYNLYESIKDQETIIIESDRKEKININYSYVQDQEIEYSPIWIDV
ncbi:hypothetical protein [Geminocystis sp. NIES-3709]|uniref:hypothetical protein n=1 Tax=Geminocystis sp. NIES-3709 TaxID=1617448 RepID=UPI001187738E|nr:hypothetical protein [Geminocystis sp. NIES-3709]